MAIKIKPPTRFTVALSGEQDQVLEDHRRQLRTTRSAVIETALIEYFAQRGIEFPEWSKRLTA